MPPKPKIPVLTVKREMYPFRFQDNATNKPSQNYSINTKHQNERISLEVEIQFVRETDKSTINTTRKRVLVDPRTTLSDLPTTLLTEIGCFIDPSLAQVEVFGLRLLDWSCLIPLDVVSEDIASSTVGDKLNVLLNYLLFFYRVSIKGCRDTTSGDVWSIVYDLIKHFTAEGAYHRLKQMNCPLLKTNSNALFDFLFQSGSVSLESLDPSFQLSFLDIFSFDNWYRSFPINQFLNVGSINPHKYPPPPSPVIVAANSNNNTGLNNAKVSISASAAAFEKLTNSLHEVLRHNASVTSLSDTNVSCSNSIQPPIQSPTSNPHHHPSSLLTGSIINEALRLHMKSDSIYNTTNSIINSQLTTSLLQDNNNLSHSNLINSNVGVSNTVTDNVTSNQNQSNYNESYSNNHDTISSTCKATSTVSETPPTPTPGVISKRKVRNRVTFVSEDLRQLEMWFKENPRPSRDRFQEYATELNRRHQGNHKKQSIGVGSNSNSNQVMNSGKRILHARNIVYWFKNARAAYKRMSNLGSDSNGKLNNMHPSDIDEGLSIMSGASSSKIDDKMEFCSTSGRLIGGGDNCGEDIGDGGPEEDEDDIEDDEEITEFKKEDNLIGLETNNVFLQSEMNNTHLKTEEVVEPEEEDPDNSGSIISGEDESMKNSQGNTVTVKHSNFQKSQSGKRRARIFLDPATEVCRLEQWFQQERYPDVLQIENYTVLLNCSPYRHNHFRKLLPENITLWFKNRRARLKRGINNTSINQEPNHLVDSNSNNNNHNNSET